mmetsp:Transcript_33210/g.77659  ORF Transcript_33210/g.77659 Transcript_33210/m.77659 type:complete len:88 (+) Transcript_33210:449-712(+)
MAGGSVRIDLHGLRCSESGAPHVDSGVVKVIAGARGPLRLWLSISPLEEETLDTGCTSASFWLRGSTPLQPPLGDLRGDGCNGEPGQ